MPLPSVPLTVFPMIVAVKVPASVRPKWLSIPARIPCEPNVLLATITLLDMVVVTVMGPNTDVAMPIPATFVIGLATVPLFEMLKLP